MALYEDKKVRNFASLRRAPQRHRGEKFESWSVGLALGSRRDPVIDEGDFAAAPSWRALVDKAPASGRNDGCAEGFHGGIGGLAGRGRLARAQFV